MKSYVVEMKMKSVVESRGDFVKLEKGLFMYANSKIKYF
jgi:hypothetical protein